MKVVEYLIGAWESVKPVYILLVTVASYLVFPDQSYVPPAIGLGVVVIIDIVTKYYSLSVLNGGLFKAIRDRKISSEALWKGSYRKIISYLVIMILVGLSARVTNSMWGITTFFLTTVYTALFIRECTSILENLSDAGHKEVDWLIFWLKRKSKEIVEKSNEDEKESKE